MSGLLVHPFENGRALRGLLIFIGLQVCIFLGCFYTSLGLWGKLDITGAADMYLSWVHGLHI